MRGAGLAHQAWAGAMLARAVRSQRPHLTRRAIWGRQRGSMVACSSSNGHSTTSHRSSRSSTGIAASSCTVSTGTRPSSRRLPALREKTMVQCILRQLRQLAVGRAYWTHDSASRRAFDIQRTTPIHRAACACPVSRGGGVARKPTASRTQNSPLSTVVRSSWP